MKIDLREDAKNYLRKKNEINIISIKPAREAELYLNQPCRWEVPIIRVF